MESSKLGDLINYRESAFPEYAENEPYMVYKYRITGTFSELPGKIDKIPNSDLFTTSFQEDKISASIDVMQIFRRIFGRKLNIFSYLPSSRVFFIIVEKPKNDIYHASRTRYCRQSITYLASTYNWDVEIEEVLNGNIEDVHDLVSLYRSYSNSNYLKYRGVNLSKRGIISEMDSIRNLLIDTKPYKDIPIKPKTLLERAFASILKSAGLSLKSLREPGTINMYNGVIVRPDLQKMSVTREVKGEKRVYLKEIEKWVINRNLRRYIGLKNYIYRILLKTNSAPYIYINNDVAIEIEEIWE